MATAAKVRVVVYWVYALLGVGLGATQVAYATATIDQPTWLTVAIAVLAYLGIALGAVAASNVQPDAEPEHAE